jgi:hypothetical protein
MKKSFFLMALVYTCLTGFSQQLNLTGGVNLAKGNIDADVLKQVIQQKQEEVFTRLFSNIIVKYFADKDPNDGVYNFATYYSLYNLMTDITVGKSKTTVSKAVINSASELAYIYSFVKFYQEQQTNGLFGVALTNANANKVQNIQLLTSVNKSGERNKNINNLQMLNFYMEAAFDVLAKSKSIQDVFYFKRPITSSEINKWYTSIGLINNSKFNTLAFNDILGTSTTLPTLIANMNGQVANFIAYATGGSDPILKIVAGLKKDANGFKTLSEDQVNAIKLLLIEFANKTDYLFDQNVVKNLINLLAENTHFGFDDTQKINQVYVDVESLILSLDKEFVTKNKRSSISSAAWFINPRLFFTIGSANGFFLNDNNKLDNNNGTSIALKNINLASEKIGFRVKIWDGGYTHAFGPGEVYKWHGKNYVWTEPQTKPLISSIYYNIYGSGLLYNVLNLKTNQNFDFGYLGSNIGLVFFNGLEFSAGVGFVYKDGLDAKNSFFKVDFDIPIIDYLTALKNKRNN